MKHYARYLFVTVTTFIILASASNAEGEKFRKMQELTSEGYELKSTVFEPPYSTNDSGTVSLFIQKQSSIYECFADLKKINAANPYNGEVYSCVELTK